MKSFRTMSSNSFKVPTPEILAHLALHLVDLTELEHVALADNRLGNVRVGVIAYHLRSEHDGGEEKMVARQSTSSGKASLKTLEDDQGVKLSGDCFAEMNEHG